MKILELRRKEIRDLAFCLAFLKNRSCYNLRREGASREEFYRCKEALFKRFGGIKVYREGVTRPLLVVDENLAKSISQSANKHLGYRPSRKNVARILTHLATMDSHMAIANNILPGKSLTLKDIKRSVLTNLK